MKLKRVFLSLGSNLGNRKNNLILAIKKLKKLPFYIKKISYFYENEAQGFETPNFFINLCILGLFPLAPLSLLLEIKKIEASMGRKIFVHKNHYEDRIIDIDIILFEKEVLNLEVLKIPHPLSLKRNFVIDPLSSISGKEEIEFLKEALC